MADARGFRRKYDNVQFRGEDRRKPCIHSQFFEKCQRRLPSAFQPARKFAPLFQRQQSLRRPQGRRGRPRTGALQAYLSQMQLGGAEIGVGRIVLVQSADFGVAKEHAAAPVWLQSMLVRIDHNRVRFSTPPKRSPSLFPEVLSQHEIAALLATPSSPESCLSTHTRTLR